MIQCPEKPTEFYHISKTAVTRRQWIRSSIAMSATAFLMGSTTLSSAIAMAPSNSNFLKFKSVPANTSDDVSVPEGFNWHVVASWGDPLWSKGESFNHQTRGTAESQALAFGDNNDGMEFFTRDGRNILAVNNEYTNLSIMYGNRQSNFPETLDDIAKGKMAVGVTIMEITEKNGNWSIVKDSHYNRRVTAETHMQMTGPAVGHELVRTSDDPKGANPIGTWHNCGSGRTPWGTYLTCEENFNRYFSTNDPKYKIPAPMKRYGIKTEDRGFGWKQLDERFDISKHPHEPNRFGYIVEIDPFDPTFVPRKHSALGRLKHENAAVVINQTNHVVVYMGDDERGEFIYRFISNRTYDPNSDNSALLANGQLYVAKFYDNMHGKWIELTPESTGMASQAEICIHTRQAGSAVQATTMDRPEWIAINPTSTDVYCCLTNNKNRGKKPNAGGDETPINGPNPRLENKYGQIIRWSPDNHDHTESEFTWDLFAIAGNPTVHSDLNAGSDNINEGNLFNSPDGLAFDSVGQVWIQTDGNYSNEGDYTGMGNNQMLVADINTGEIKRFLVGPRECEVTGITWSSDKKTLFVNIQHPGERGHSNFPEGGESVPRSSIVAIKRDDGQAMG